MSRKLLACVTLLAALALALPAIAAANGPSAGDQQYIDPLAGSSHHGSSHSQSSQAATTPAAPAPTSSGAAPASSSTASTSAGATARTTSAASTDAPSSKSLPMTGFSALLAAVIGACLVATGAMLWRASRPA